MFTPITTDSINTAIRQITKGELKQLLVPDLEAKLADKEDTARDVIREAFQQNGVEVEFSGKGPFEKGVVIDMDEEAMQQLGLDPDVLRFGQTVVRIEVN